MFLETLKILRKYSEIFKISPLKDSREIVSRRGVDRVWNIGSEKLARCLSGKLSSGKS